MLAANNLLKPSDGKPVAVPTQDMVLGSYYLTLVKPGRAGRGQVLPRCPAKAIMAYDAGAIGLHSKIKTQYDPRGSRAELRSQLYETTLGRVIFNDPIPQDLGFVDRSRSGKCLQAGG